MITSLFGKSTFLNYFLVAFLLVGFFFLYQFGDVQNNGFGVVQQTITLLVLLISFFLTNFIVKKNGLTKNSSYSILFFLMFFALFPKLFSQQNLLFANFFLLLAFRRMISLQTLKAPKEKIFDASMWIFIAALFHFWCVLFILLVYISIIFHVSRDYRNWLIPFVAFFGTVIIYTLVALLFDVRLISELMANIQLQPDWSYFLQHIREASLLIFAFFGIYFTFSMIFTLQSKPLVLQASYKKMVIGFFIGIAVFILTPVKSNEILIFSFMPLAVLGTNNIEYSQNKTYQEIILFVLIISSVLSFFVQL